MAKETGGGGVESLAEAGEKFGKQREWRVERLLGAGGFGAVYLVVNEKTEVRGAMKVESTRLPDDNQVLKMERAIMESLQGKSHFCEILHAGRTAKLNYLIMTLVGRNLTDLRKGQPAQKFSPSTAFRLAWDGLDAIQEFHSIDHVHRGEHRKMHKKRLWVARKA